MLRAMSIRSRISFVLALCALVPPITHSKVIRVEVLSRVDVLGGKAFGDVGAYERITGRVYFSVAVANAHNARIVDLGNAANLKDGEVAFASDFIVVRPKDAKRSNGTLLLEVPNRGHGGIIRLVDGGGNDLATDTGDSWLLRNGFTLVTLGWQWDATGTDSLRLSAPIAKDHGTTITGLLRGDLMLSKEREEIPLGHLIIGNIGGSEYPAAAPDDPRNVLSVREWRNAPRAIISRSEWRFAHTVGGKLERSDRY